MKKALVESTLFCCTEIMSRLMVNSRRSGGTPLVIPRVRVCVRLGLFVSHSEKAFQLHLAVAGGNFALPFRDYSAPSMLYPARVIHNSSKLRSLTVP